MEKWFFKHQESDPDLTKYFCIDELRRCCSSGHWGAACEPCPAVSQKLDPCYGRGECNVSFYIKLTTYQLVLLQGDGTRGGNGKCKCDRGYVGHMCSNCDAHFYPVEQNNTYIECGECFDGCASGCTTSGPKGCRACRSGYIMDVEEGCKDIDECLEDGKCTKDNEKCVNTIGSYRCECGEGYRRNKDQECEIDIEGWFILF